MRVNKGDVDLCDILEGSGRVGVEIWGVVDSSGRVRG